MSTNQTIILKHSTVKDKLPSSAQYGEVFVNYNQENPFLATINNQGQFEKFLSENKLNELYYNKSQVNDIIANLESGGTIDFDDYYKKNEVDTLLQGKSDTGHTHSYTALTDLPDLSIYLTEHQDISYLATKQELESYQSISGMSSYLTVSQAEQDFQPKGDYVAPSDLDDYLTIASASTIYATKEELEEHIPTVDAYTKAETDTLLQGKSDTGHTHDYETLANKPDLSNFATKGEIPDTSGFATKQELEDYQMKSGMTSYLTIAQAEQDLQPKGDYALKSEIPDVSNFVTSAFTDATYAKKGEVPTDVYTKSESDSKFQPQSGMTDYALKSEIPSTTGLASEEWVSNNFSSTAHTHSDLATKSELENYLTIVSASTTYATKSEIPDISDLATKSEIPDTSSFVTSAFTDATYAKKGEVPSDAYTKAETDTLLAGKANSAHTHTMSEITDLDVPKTWRGTLSEYNNLTEIDNDTLYIITDSSEQLVTSGDVESMISGYTNLTEVQTLLEGYSTTAHTHDYSEIQNTPDLSGFASLSDIPDTSNFITSGFCEDRYQPKGTYVVPSDLNDYALKSEIPSIDGLATEAELANYQPVSSMTGYSTTAHTHSYNDLTDKPTIPSTSGLASETWVTNNFAGTGHTHSQYLTETSADTRYARVVSLTQAQYDALVQNDQVEQGVLYCIIEQSNS